MSTPTCGELSCDECDARTTALTAEIAHLRAEVERLKKQIKDDNRSYGCELRDPNGTIWEQAAKDHARAERAEAELDALSKVKALLFDALEHYQNCVIAGGKNPARDGIAAAMKEGAIK